MTHNRTPSGLPCVVRLILGKGQRVGKTLTPVISRKNPSPAAGPGGESSLTAVLPRQACVVGLPRSGPRSSNQDNREDAAGCPRTQGRRADLEAAI